MSRTAELGECFDWRMMCRFVVTGRWQREESDGCLTLGFLLGFSHEAASSSVHPPVSEEFSTTTPSRRISVPWDNTVIA